MVADVVDGQRDGAVSPDARHGDLAGVGGVGDGPTFTVSHGLADAGAQLPVVAPRDNDVADHRPVTVDTGSRDRVEFAVAEAVLLDSGVDRDDVFVAGRHDRQRLTCVATPSPGLHDRVEMILKAAGTDSATGGIRRDGVGVTGAEAQCGGCFPAVCEAVELLEFDRTGGVAEFGEHATTPDRLQLEWVTDQRQAPLSLLGVHDEAVEVGSVQHGGLVDHDRRPRRWDRPRPGPVWVVEFIEQLGDRVTLRTGLLLQHRGGSCRRRQPDHDTMLVVEVGDGGFEHRGLARTRRTNDHDQTVVAGDGARGGSLSVVESTLDDRRRR